MDKIKLILEDLIRKIKKVPPMILLTISIFLIIVIGYVTQSKPQTDKNTEKVTYSENVRQDDVGSQLAALKKESQNLKEQLNAGQQDSNKTFSELSDKINGIDKKNIVSVKTEVDSKIITMKNGEIFKVENNSNNATKIGSLIDDAKKQIPNIVKENKYTNGNTIVEDTQGKKFLIKNDGTITELNSATMNPTGDGIVYQSKSGEMFKMDSNGVITPLTEQEKQNLKATNIDGVLLTNVKEIKEDVPMTISSDGSKYIQKPDGVYKINPDGTTTKVGNKLSLDKSENIYVDDKIVGKNVADNVKKQNSIIDKDGNLVFLNKNGEIVKKSRNGQEISLGKGYIGGTGQVVITESTKNNSNVPVLDKKEFKKPLSVVQDEQGNIYENKNGQIYKNGKLIGSGQIIQNDDGTVSILDNKENIVQKINNPVKTNSTDNEFRTKDGTLYKAINDNGINKIVAIDKTGKITNLGKGTITVNGNVITIDSETTGLQKKELEITLQTTVYVTDKFILTVFDTYYVLSNKSNILESMYLPKNICKLANENGNYKIVLTKGTIPLGTIEKEDIYQNIDNTTFKYKNLIINNYQIKNDNSNKNGKQDKIYLTKDNQILNFNGNTIKSKLNESLLIKIPGQLNIQNKNIVSQINKENIIDCGKTTNQIGSNIIKIKNKDISVLVFKGNTYLINEDGILNLGSGQVDIKNGQLLFNGKSIGNVQFKNYKHLQGKSIVDGLVGRITTQTTKNSIGQKDIKGVGRTAVFGEFFTLTNGKKVFYNESNDVSIIEPDGTITNAPNGQIYVTELGKKQQSIYVISNQEYKYIGEVSFVSIGDNTIYKTTGGTFYINDNTLYKLDKKLINMTGTAIIKSDKLYIHKNNMTTYLGDIISILVGNYSGDIELNSLNGSTDFDKTYGIKKVIKEKTGFSIIKEDGLKEDVKDVKLLPNKSLEITLKNGKVLTIESMFLQKTSNGWIINKFSEQTSKFTNDDTLDSIFGNPKAKTDLETTTLKEKLKITEQQRPQYNGFSQTDSKKKNTNKIFAGDEEKVQMGFIYNNEATKRNTKMFATGVTLMLNNQQQMKSHKTTNIASLSDKRQQYVIPLGQSIAAMLETGAIAPFTLGSRGTSFVAPTVFFKVTKNVTLRDGTTIPLRNAVISAEPKADGAGTSKRMSFVLKEIVFWDDDEESWFTGQIKGTVTWDKDGVMGIPGIIIDNKDEYLAKSTAYSILSGISQYLVATKSPLNAANALSSTTGSQSANSLNDSLGQNVLGGAGKTLDDISKTLLQMMNAETPIIAVRPNQPVHIMIDSLKIFQMNQNLNDNRRN